MVKYQKRRFSGEKGEKENVDLVAKDDLCVLIKKGGNKDFTRKIKVNENPTIPINTIATIIPEPGPEYFCFI